MTNEWLVYLEYNKIEGNYHILTDKIVGASFSLPNRIPCHLESALLVILYHILQFWVVVSSTWVFFRSMLITYIQVCRGFPGFIWSAGNAQDLPGHVILWFDVFRTVFLTFWLCSDEGSRLSQHLHLRCVYSCGITLFKGQHSQ